MLSLSRPSRAITNRTVGMMAANTLPQFARHMVELRKKLGWSQPALAEKVGTAANVIGRYERGEVTPSIEMAKRIGDALNVSLDYMIGETASDNPQQEREILERCRVVTSLPEDDQCHIIFVLDALIRDARARTAYGR